MVLAATWSYTENWASWAVLKLKIWGPWDCVNPNSACLSSCSLRLLLQESELESGYSVESMKLPDNWNERLFTASRSLSVCKSASSLAFSILLSLLLASKHEWFFLSLQLYECKLSIDCKLICICMDWGLCVDSRPNRMHEMRTNATDDPVAWFACLSVCQEPETCWTDRSPIWDGDSGGPN